MIVYGYLRVSTDQQDVENQRYGLLVYANTHGLGPLHFVEDTASGHLAWRDRAVERLLTETAHVGDVVLFTEMSRMARSTLQVLEMLEHCMTRGISVHIAKQQMVLDGSMQSRVTATVLGLAAEIEREMISLRTTEALAKRKATGLPLGRPKGAHAPRRRLDAKATEIQSYLAKRISKRSIAKLVECAPSTLYEWLARRHFHVRQPLGMGK
jgi:DNA invertase Pin-like site-specific DNA recombinase